MSYSDDAWAVDKFEKLRMFAIVLALSLFAAYRLLDIPWLRYPEALAWLTAGIASIYEARAVKRMGRDPDSSYLRAAIFVIVAGLCVI